MTNAVPTKKIHIDEEDEKTVLNYIGKTHWLGQDYMSCDVSEQAKFIRSAMLRTVDAIENSNGS